MRDIKTYLAESLTVTDLTELIQKQKDTSKLERKQKQIGNKFHKQQANRSRFQQQAEEEAHKDTERKMAIETEKTTIQGKKFEKW